MTTIDLTLEQCERSVEHALAWISTIQYQEGEWNSSEFLIKEHCAGAADAGGTVYKCAVGFNIDFDLRCTCCGAILAMGSVDIDGPVHATAQHSEPVVLARSRAELCAALGVSMPKGVSAPRPRQLVLALYLATKKPVRPFVRDDVDIQLRVVRHRYVFANYVARSPNGSTERAA